MLISFVSGACVQAQDHPNEQCSGSNPQAGRVQLSAVIPASATGWQCYGAGRCSSFELHAGDSIQIARVENGWTCGYVTSADGAGPEWIRSSDLAPVKAADNPPLSAWLGTWAGGEDVVHIKASATAGSLELDGEATWNGRNGNQHFGDIQGEARPAGNKLHYVKCGCVVDMELIGDYMLASDNLQCGGLNARFGGVWRRKQQ